MYKISILIPTCNRPTLFQNCIQSISQNTKQLENLELLVIVDNTDDPTQDYVRKVMSQYRNIAITMLLRERSELLNEDYYNWAGRQATGDLIWIFADDLVVVAPNWDEVVQREVESFTKKYPDMVFCVSIKDNTPPPSHRLPKFPCFPMFTKQCLPALGGWYLHPKVPTWGADYITYCIFQPIERLLELHDRNYINHVSWHTKQVEVDGTNKRIGEIFNKLKMIPHHNTDRILSEEVPVIRGKLLDYVDPTRLMKGVPE